MQKRFFEERLCAKWKKDNTQPCPNCKAPIQKNDGCSHMTCKACAFEFCWICRQKVAYWWRMSLIIHWFLSLSLCSPESTLQSLSLPSSLHNSLCTSMHTYDRFFQYQGRYVTGAAANGSQCPCPKPQPAPTVPTGAPGAPAAPAPAPAAAAAEGQRR